MIVTGLGAENHSAEAATQEQLISSANKYLGTPYVYGGTTANGFDCSGYTQAVFRNLGISLPRTSKAQYGVGSAVSRQNLEVGDLVFFNTSGSGVSHVGIYYGDNKFINAESAGVKVSSMGSSYWSKRYIGAKRVASFNTGEVASATEEVKKETIDFSVIASRGEVALQLAKMLGLDTSNTASPFVDVKSNSKYAGAVTALHKAGIFTGDEHNKFNPNSPLTRNHMAKILVEAFDMKMGANKLTFPDVSKSHWSYEYIQILASNGVTTGKANGTYGGSDYVRHTQLNKFLERAAKL